MARAPEIHAVRIASAALAGRGWFKPGSHWHQPRAAVGTCAYLLNIVNLLEIYGCTVQLYLVGWGGSHLWPAHGQ